MGAIILQSQHEPRSGPKVDRHIVVDGQQRLTTLQLLIRAVQQCFRNLGDNERANELQKWTENDEDYWDGDHENQTKVRQSNVSDRSSFQNVIREGTSSSTVRRIDEGFNFFVTRITEWLDEDPSDRDRRSDALKDTLSKHMMVATVDLDQNEKPHFIFAVLNARAEPLLQSDHIKNEVMYGADVVDDEKEAEQLWGFFDNNQWWRQDTKEGRLSRIHLDRFLHYWTAMTVGKDGADVVADKVYSFFKRFVPTDSSAIRDTASKIRDAGQIYRDMEEARQPGIEMFLKRIRTMELGVVMPLLLWLYTEEISNDERIQTTRALESYLVRRMLCGLQSQGLNRLFFELLDELRTKDRSEVSSGVITFLNRQTVDNREWPNDSSVRQNLVENPLRATARRQTMVLEAIELHLRTNMSEALADDKLSLEHSMPESWERHWPLPPDLAGDADAIDTRNRAVNEIGNLTLVTGKLNSSLSNAPWNEKRVTLGEHSTLLLNRELLRMAGDEWDESAIKNRSEWMVDKIIEIWPHAEEL